MAFPVDRRQFLLREHDRIRTSEQIFWPDWETNFERFFADLSDMIPTWIGKRYLSSKDKALGIIPGNVEWHFKKQRDRLPTATSPAVRAKKTREPSKELPAKGKKELARELKVERRRKLAEEFRRWEELRRPCSVSESAQLRAPRVSITQIRSGTSTDIAVGVADACEKIERSIAPSSI